MLRTFLGGVNHPKLTGSISLSAVQSFVMPELDAAAASHYWIGLSDLATPGTYLWSSGEHVLYTAWNSNHTGLVYSDIYWSTVFFLITLSATLNHTNVFFPS